MNFPQIRLLKPRFNGADEPNQEKTAADGCLSGYQNAEIHVETAQIHQKLPLTDP
jgi:hypothetical protein